MYNVHLILHINIRTHTLYILTLVHDCIYINHILCIHSLQGMERMLSNIMAECDRLGVSSVAFPAIGTGVLHFPDDTVAKTMIKAISTYLHKHPSTTVKQVLLVIFEDRSYKAFQSAMQTSTSVPTPSYTPGAVQQPGRSLYEHADKSGTLSDTRDRSKPFIRQVSSSVDATSPIQLKRGGLTDHQVRMCVCECYVRTFVRTYICTYVS